MERRRRTENRRLPDPSRCDNESAQSQKNNAIEIEPSLWFIVSQSFDVAVEIAYDLNRQPFDLESNALPLRHESSPQLNINSIYIFIICDGAPLKSLFAPQLAESTFQYVLLECFYLIILGSILNGAGTIVSWVFVVPFLYVNQASIMKQVMLASIYCQYTNAIQYTKRYSVFYARSILPSTIIAIEDIQRQAPRMSQNHRHGPKILHALLNSQRRLQNS